MLQIKQVELHNFCQHRDFTLKFGPGVTGIVGSNGSGKSNTVKGVRFAAVGESGNVGAKIDDLNWQAAAEGEAGFVMWTFEKDGVEGVLKRYINTSRATLRFGEVRCTSARDTNAEILRIMGVTKKTVEDIVFVMQGEIEQILFERPSDRARKFQGLFGTESAEKLRELLHRELAAISTDPVDDRIAELKQHLTADVDPQLRQLNDEKQALVDVVSVADLTALRHVVTRWTQALESDSKLMELGNADVAVENASVELEQQLVGTEEDLAAAAIAVTAVAETIQTKRVQLESLEEAQKLFDTQRSLTADFEKYQVTLAKAVDPVEPSISAEQIDIGLQQVAEASVSVKATATFVSTFVDKTGDPICPTCQQPVLEAELLVAKYIAELPDRRKRIAESKTMLEQAKDAYLSYTQGLQSAVATRKAVRSAMDSIKNNLDRLGDVPAIDGDSVTQLKLDVTNHDDAVRMRDAFTEHIATLRTTLAANRAQQKAIVKQAEELNAQLKNRPSEQDAADAEQAIHQTEESNLRVAELEGRLKQLQAERARVLAELQGLDEQSSDLEAKRKYRDLCDRARTVLHRDNLPHMVTVAYLRALNEQLAQYLTVFGVDFGCFIADDLRVTCYFPGAGEKPAGRLSGGQKVLLGIAFRFAVYNLFANSMGFMILDEPTSMLDNDSIRGVVEVLQRVGRHAANTGMQLIVITHEPALAAAFDRTIEL